MNGAEVISTCVCKLELFFLLDEHQLLKKGKYSYLVMNSCSLLISAVIPIPQRSGMLDKFDCFILSLGMTWFCCDLRRGP